MCVKAEVLDKIRESLIQLLSQLVKEGHKLSSPIVIQVSEILDEVTDELRSLKRPPAEP